MPTEQVIIEFISDTTQLQPAEDKLTNFGKIDQKSAAVFKATNEELKTRNQLTDKLTQNVTKEQAVIAKLTASLKSLKGESKAVVENLLKLSGKSIVEVLDKAGQSADDYVATLKKAGTETVKTEAATTSLRTQLRNMIQTLTQMKVAGQDNTEQYKKLSKEAGHLKDSLADVTQEVTRLGSDTATFDGLINAAQGLAGGFAVAQGAAALFGDSSEEVQEVLLRVNAAMAILQGLQQLQTVFQKESAASLLLLNIQRRIHNASIAIENGLQSQSVIVRGAATVAQKALNVAMAANPIGLVVVALTTLIALLSVYASNARAAAEDTAILNAALRDTSAGLEAEEKGLKATNDRIVSDLEAAGAKQSEILLKNLNTEKRIYNARVKSINDLRDKLAKTPLADIEVIAKINDQIFALENSSAEKRQEIYLKENDLRKQLREEDKVGREKAIENQKKADEDARKARISVLNDQLAAFERQLLAAEKSGGATIEIQKKIIAQKAKIELEGENLTKNQKLLIQEQSLEAQLALQRENNKKLSAEALAQQISRNNAELAQLNLSDQDKLRLTIENIIIAAQAEADLAEGNIAKIKEINAKRDFDIKTARLTSLQQTLDDELRLEKVNNAALTRELQRKADNEQLPLAARKQAIDELSKIELSAIAKRIDALNASSVKGLISYKEYNIKYKELTDEQVKAVEDAEKKKQDATKKTLDDQKKQTQELVGIIVDLTSQVGNTLFSGLQANLDRQQQNIQNQRSQVDDLRRAGAITEKEHLERLKKLDAEERKLKREQARKDKELAIFNATVSTAQAVIKAYATTGPIAGPVLAAIVGAIGAAQIAFIAARKIPQFAKGKKGNYEGLGEIGETGAELLESKGRMYVAKKKTIVWLGKSDKVYNPKETQKIIERSLPTVNNVVISGGKQGQAAFDYERLGKEIGKHTSMSLSIDGYKDFIKEQQSFTTYLNNRRAY